MTCNQECKKDNPLYSSTELKLVGSQHPNYKVITAENIAHKGNQKNIDSRAIIFAPVGNSSLFWNDEKEQLLTPQIILIGFSTSYKAMEQFYKLHKKNDFKTSCKLGSFSGSPILRKNIIQMFDLLGLGTRFNLDSMFEIEQTNIFYTQIIKCCSVGKVNGVYKDSSAIYPSLVNKTVRETYLNNSGHRNCIENIFLNEINFNKKIPLVLLFKPAWDNLKSMNLLSKINGKIVEWLPHPSNPGADVIKLLTMFSEDKDINDYNWCNSAKQLLKIKEQLQGASDLF